MTSPMIYDIGTVTLTNGSAEVSGDGTAWAINGVVGGVFSCDGMSVPIVSVDDDDTLTLAYPWPGSNASDAAYAISLINSQAADTIWANRHWSRVVGQALLAAIRPDASGTLAERDALNPMLDNGQWFARAEPPHDLEFYRKVPGGWEGPFTTRGVGGVGEGGLGIPSPGAADKMPYYSDADTISLTDLTPFARTLLDDTDADAARATLGVLGLPSPGAADKMPYYSDADTISLTDLTAFGRALAALTGADGSIPVATGAGAAAMRAIVGTVSHVGGVPTGALMEQGGNANGWYWRFANRMQICARQVTVADSGYVAASWAAAFFDTSYFCAGVSASSSSAALFLPKMHTKSISGAMFAGITSAQAFGNGTFDFIAIGRGI